ncbi:rhodanese-like domain-containing protein [Mycolicibacterium psychrotolerans]|uniref:rhodanese-like domain-containing protein n=1 Tax=Mycolicibacterium psychrotolerans TaxID=216929 RepID=UPI003898E632
MASGSIPGAIHLPLAQLRVRLGRLPAGRPIVVHCAGGGAPASRPHCCAPRVSTTCRTSRAATTRGPMAMSLPDRARMI